MILNYFPAGPRPGADVVGRAKSLPFD